MPLTTQAGFLADLLGTDAVAGTPETISSNLSETNSQNMTLLQANVSSASIIEDKKQSKTTKTAKKDDESAIKEDVDISIVSDNALSPATSPLGVSDGTQNDEESFSDQVSIYVIRKGDSIGNIAKMFGVSVNTIYWVNDLKKGDKLKEGETLVILPFDGLTHTVKAKETLVGIAKLYKADIDDIIAFNGITKNEKLSVGDELVIPDGQKSEESDKPVKNSNSSSTNSSSAKSKNLKSVDGYFIFPLPFKKQTQGTHDRYAKDYGAPTGTPIYAAASGTVVVAKGSGYNGGYGLLVIIKHPNDTETRYAHMSKIRTSVGKQVSQGEIIGDVGSTGRSTGPHLHFEARGVDKFPF
ncbi:MAG: Peptidase M23 family protein [Candidatus Nomurabacteria bacterium GW2011_GWA2_40_9]|uniref:Peptidase M23 family protein n=1 Tax=Candidatus Nomurabacteria bacterium GW2011_GWA2_40_9 TaxID=1618734 RepID=A0A0G0TTN5_9BACT|nr:MAG: Peptidase M23 family protein [Candidatus Nomurabacteria bacterium GW2011_GWA2_40_9]